MSLKKKLVLLGISFVIIPFLLAGIITYHILSRSLLDVAKDKSLRYSKELSHLVDISLKQEVRLLDAISLNRQIIQACKSGDYKLAQDYIQSVYNNIGKEYSTIFILDRHGITMADARFIRQKGLDLSDRSYFIQARLGKPTITGPLKSRGSHAGTPIIIVSTPIQENGKFLGMVGMIFDTDFLSMMLSQNKIGKTGYAYVLDTKGLVLGHPNKEFILKLNLLEQPGSETLRHIIRERSSASINYQFGGVNKIIGISTVGINGWKVVFSQDREEIMAPLNEIMSVILFSAIILLIITIPIIAAVWGKVSNPIQSTIDLLQTLTQHSKDCFLQIDLNRRITYANPTFLSVTGQKLIEVIQKEPNLNNENQTPPQDIWNDLEAGNSWSGHIIYEKPNSETVILDMMILSMKDFKDEVKGFLAIGKDITEELKYKKRMQQTHKLEAIGTLAGGIAHDFNNILGGIYGYAQLSLSRKKSREDIEKYVNQIIKGADRARELVSQILVFSRQKDVNMQPMSPRPVIKEALKLLRASIPNTIEIESNIKSDSIILAESTQIHQIVMNLVTNAAHAIGNNAGFIKLDLEDYFVDEEFTKAYPEIHSGKHIFLRISDSGSGMERDVLDHIFEPFFSTKTQDKGSGLGLSVVHGIVKKMNGIITAYSELGKGTVFNIFIPCVETGDVAQPEQQALVRGGNERILIVDDEPAIANSTEMLLANLGYKVTAFTDSPSALKAIKNSPFDFELIISDYTMPNITGPEIVKDLKKAGINIPIILTSGFFSHEMEEEIQALNVSALLRKPVDTYHLTDAIRKALAHQEDNESPPEGA